MPWSSLVYRALPYILAVIAILDLGLGILRIYIFFSPKSSADPKSLWEIARYTFRDEVASPLLSSRQTQAAFALDWISSIVPTLMGLYLILFGIVAFFSLCACCDGFVKKIKADNPRYQKCGRLGSVMCFMCMNKANHRFVSLACNCPCYRARPQRRFQVRLGLIGFFLLLRLIATILYGTDRTVRTYGQQMACICGISLALLLLVMLIDVYQFRVWWYYQPAGIYRPCRCCCCAPKFFPPHQRFLPMPLLGKFRDMTTMGNRPCVYAGHASCPDRSLEHIAMFHGYNYKPLKRFDPRKDKYYIGFHQTKNEIAEKIAQGGFKISDKGDQMLGYGVYFARSFADTNGKARKEGAYVVAEVEMGKVRVVEKEQLHEVENSSAWWSTYDTIYYKHRHENRDEFCIKDPRQIKKWIIVMDDPRVYSCGLDREFSDTVLGVI